MINVTADIEFDRITTHLYWDLRNDVRDLIAELAESSGETTMRINTVLIRRFGYPRRGDCDYSDLLRIRDHVWCALHHKPDETSR